MMIGPCGRLMGIRLQTGAALASFPPRGHVRTVIPTSLAITALLGACAPLPPPTASKVSSMPTHETASSGSDEREVGFTSCPALLANKVQYMNRRSDTTNALKKYIQQNGGDNTKYRAKITQLSKVLVKMIKIYCRSVETHSIVKCMNQYSLI